MHLKVKASIPNIDEEKFQKLAEKAKEGCPVSKVLKAEISMDASLS
ncbi:OsmC family protein [Burkholderia sp. SIMBA_045]